MAAQDVALDEMLPLRHSADHPDSEHVLTPPVIHRRSGKEGKARFLSRNASTTAGIVGLTVLILLLAAASRTGNAKSSLSRDINKVVVFGDSLSEICSGYLAMNNGDYSQPFHKVCPDPPHGRSTGARQWPELLPDKLGDRALDIISLARDGSTCTSKYWPRIWPRIDVKEQIDTFAAQTHDPSRTLCIVFVSGVNEFDFFVKTFLGADEGGLPYPNTTSVGELADCVGSQVERLLEMGFRRQIVFEIPAVQFFPIFNNNPFHPDSKHQIHVYISQLVQAYNKLLHLRIESINAKYDASVEIFPAAAIFTALLSADPYHLYPQKSSNKLCASDPAWDNAKPNSCKQYFFKDLWHPSQPTMEILASELAVLIKNI